MVHDSKVFFLISYIFLIAKVPIYNSSYISEKTKGSMLPNLKQPNQDRMILGTSSAHKEKSSEVRPL